MKRLYPFAFVLFAQLSFGQAITITPKPSEGGILATGGYFDPVLSTPLPIPGVPASGQGTRLMWIPSISAFRAGTVDGSQWDNVNIGAYSFAAGLNSKAQGSASFAMGYNVTAGENYSVAMGNSSSVNAYSAFALGNGATAYGNYSTAMGYLTLTAGEYSTALGILTAARAYGSTVIGIANNSDGYSPNLTIPVPTNRIFEIGNGTFSPTTYSNALTVYQSARTVINDVTVTDAMFRVKHNSGINDSHVVLYEDGNDYGRLTFKNSTTNNFWTVAGAPQATAATSQLNLYFDNAGVGVNAMSLAGNGNAVFLGCVSASNLSCPSDIRYKKNIQPLSNALQNIHRIQGVRYDWKRDEFPEKYFSKDSQIGFIAQDIERIFPEMVITDEKGYKSVDYARLTPVLVEAVKELTHKNAQLENRLAKIEAMLSEKNEVVTAKK